MINKFLSNGVQVVVKEDHRCDLLTLQAWVGVGSVHELPGEEGMAHCLEHMLFKGTARRTVGEIARTVEACGGGINAYTTFDRTVFYLTVASSHSETASDVLADALFSSSFEKDELTREIEVICEEIRRSNDSPASQVGRKLFEICYDGSPAARPIIGYADTVKSFNRSDVAAFHERWYRPENITIVAAGNFDSEQMLAVLQRDFGSATAAPIPAKRIADRCFPKEGLVELLRGDYQQPRLELVMPAPALGDPNAIYLDLAAFALGSGDSSRLVRQVRDDKHLVAAIGSSVYAPLFGGLFSISAYPIIESFKDALFAIGEVFGELRYGHGVDQRELEKAVANLKADYRYQQETIDGLAKSIGYGLTTPFGEYFEDVYMGAVAKAEPSAIAWAIEQWLDESRAVIVGMVHEDSSVEADGLRESFLDGVQKGRGSHKKTSESAKITPKLTKIETHDLNPGLKVVYRQLPQAPFMSMVAVSEGGVRGETVDDAGWHNLVTQILGKQAEGYSYEDYLEQIDGRGATLDGFSGKDSYGLRLHCLPEQWSRCLEFFKSSLNHAQLPDVLWESALNEVKEKIKSQEDAPSGVAFRRFQKELYEDHPYRFPIFGTAESLMLFEKDGLEHRLRKNRDSGPWVLGLVGPLSLDEVMPEMEGVAQWFQPAEARRDFYKVASTMPSSGQIHVAKQREQTHIVVGVKGMRWSDEDRAACDVLASILGGQGGRLFYKLRDQQSLAYSVSAMVNHGYDPGFFAAYIATAPEKSEHALEELKRELFLLTEERPSKGEVERAINVLQGNHEEDLQRGNSQALTMALMELYGVGGDDFLEYPAKLSKVRDVDVVEVARKLFNPDHLITVVVG